MIGRREIGEIALPEPVRQQADRVDPGQRHRIGRASEGDLSPKGPSSQAYLRETQPSTGEHGPEIEEADQLQRVEGEEEEDEERGTALEPQSQTGGYEARHRLYRIDEHVEDE